MMKHRFHRIPQDSLRRALSSPAEISVNPKKMKILLQNTRTLKFISRPTAEPEAGWTAELAEARVFATGLEAVFHCYRNEIMNMQMLVAFDDEQKNFTVSVTDTRTA